MTSDASALAIRVPRRRDIVDVVSPVLLDPSTVFDDLPLDPGLEMVLAEAGWDCEDVLRRRWLRVAVMHVSYINERQGDLPVNAELLRMLDSLGSRWCRLYTLQEFVSRKPHASAHEQSRTWADYSAFIAEQLGRCLHVDQAILLGRGEAFTSRDPLRRRQTHRSVTWQIIGIMCMLGGLPSVSRLTTTVYRTVVTQSVPAADWFQVLGMHSRESDLTWAYRRSGPDHQTVFEASITDRRGRIGKGTSSTKSGARSAAAEDFIRRHLPAVARGEANAVTRRQRSWPTRPAAKYANLGAAHEQALRYLREIFEFPSSADPLLAQALTHASWAHEHQALVDRANQRDYTALAHLGSVVADTLIAHEHASRVAAQSLTPTEDEARLMTPQEQRFWDLFEDLQLQPGLLLGAGVASKSMRSIGAESMQAMLGVAWKYRREGMLTRRPDLLDAWLKLPSTLLDPSASLQQMCSEFRIDYSVDYIERGPDHDRTFAAVLRFPDGPKSVMIRGPFAQGKANAKRLASEQALVALDANLADGDQSPEGFFLRKQILGVGAADTRRCLLRGWLGVSHIASADLAAFGRWAGNVERTIGPLSQDDLARMRSYYERCLLITRRGSLPLLRSMFSETTEWIQGVESAANVRAASRWDSFRAVAAALGAITATVPSSVRQSISEWYGPVADRIDVNLSSDMLDEDQDDLTAAQATALGSLLGAASGAVADGGRLQVALYRQDNSAYIAVTSESADLHPALADFIRLLEECVSYFACVHVEQGWLIGVRYVNPVTPTRLADLGRSLEAADERGDLLPLARRTTDLLNLIETGATQDDADLDYQIRAAALFQRRGLI